MKLILEEIFRVPLTAMRINRSHPDIPKDLKWFPLFLIMHGLFSFTFVIVIHNIFCHNLKDQDFVQTSKNGTVAALYVSVTFLYMIIVWKKVTINRLFKIVAIDYKKMHCLSTQEQEIVLKYANKAKLLGRLWFIILFCGIGVFPIKNLILQIYYYCLKEPRVIHLYELIYPRFIEERKDNIYVYLLLYGCTLYYEIYCSFIYASFAPLAPNLMLHACGQLEILTNRAEKIFSAENVTIELRSVAIELQRIYDFVEEIKEAFRVSYELIMKATAVIIPVTLYEVLEALRVGEVSVEFLVFIIGAIIISSSPCYFSEMLMEKGEMLRMAVYSCGWEHAYERRTRKTLALLLQGASRPIALRTMFRTLSLDALTDVYHTAYAIFNLMNAMWK